MPEDNRRTNVAPVMFAAQQHALADQVGLLSRAQCADIADELRNIITLLEFRIARVRTPS